MQETATDPSGADGPGEPTTGESATGDAPATGTSVAEASATEVTAETTATPCEPDICGDLECGGMGDGCGGELDCGGCPEGLSCVKNRCDAKEFSGAKLVWSSSQMTYPVRAVQWNHDGGQIAAGGCADFPTEGEFVVWNSMTQVPVIAYQYPASAVLKLAWSPDGEQVVLGTRSSRPQIYDASTGAFVAELGGCHDGEINGVDWRADGKQIASAGGAAASPGAKPEWCIWDAASHEQLHKETASDTYAVNDIAFSFDGKSYAVVTDEFFSVYDVASHASGQYVDFTGSLEEPWTLDGVDWSPDNKRLLIWTFTEFFMIDLESGEIGGGYIPEGITEGTWSPSGLKFAFSVANGRVRVIDRLSGALELEFAAHDVATTIDWSFHEQYIATGGEVPRIAVWQLDY